MLKVFFFPREKIQESHKTMKELEIVHKKYIKRQEVRFVWVLYIIIVLVHSTLVIDIWFFSQVEKM